MEMVETAEQETTIEGVLDKEKERRRASVKQNLQDALISSTAKFGLGASGLIFLHNIFEHGIPGLPSGAVYGTAVLAGTLAAVLAESKLFSKFGSKNENKD